MSAAYLVSVCSPDVNISIIDKFQGTSVGVGEATLISFISFLEKCGFSEKTWFDEIDATIKGGILFKNWQYDGEDIWHPFSYYMFDGKYDNGISLWSNNQNLPFVDYALPEYELLVNRKGLNENITKSVARHVDCNKLVQYIKNKLSDKISFINSEVIQVVKDDVGSIEKIILKNGQQIKSDLYIDCTGFKKVLSSDCKKILLTDRLFCDTAVAGHVQYENKKEELHPYTACDAVEHGWIWKIPVQTRIGTGLVFNRSITDPEHAKDFFVDYWKGRIDKESLRVIDWTPYYSEKFWNNNVISIGLSGGFIEPLESTGLQIIQTGVEILESVLQKSFYSQDDINLYNLKMSITYDETVDYVSMHYFNSNKKGKFWDFVREKSVNLNERTNFYLNLMKTNNLHIDIFSGESIFAAYNWILWLVQLNYPITNLGIGCDKYESRQIIKENYESALENINNAIDADIFCELYSQII